MRALNLRTRWKTASSRGKDEPEIPPPHVRERASEQYFMALFPIFMISSRKALVLSEVDEERYSAAKNWVPIARQSATSQRSGAH